MAAATLAFVLVTVGCDDGNKDPVPEDPPVYHNTWTAVTNSTFSDSGIRGITYGDGKFVAVGVAGKMAYSSDGIGWTEITDKPFGNSGNSGINGITYGGGEFVAVGNSGKMAYSSDGITWAAATGNTFGTSHIFGITYGGGKFVAGGDFGKMAYSSDGIGWTEITGSKFGNSGINGITYAARNLLRSGMPARWRIPNNVN